MLLTKPHSIYSAFLFMHISIRGSNEFSTFENRNSHFGYVPCLSTSRFYLQYLKTYESNTDKDESVHKAVSKLEFVNLTNCNISLLPENFGQGLKRLYLLNISSNSLQMLPTGFNKYPIEIRTINLNSNLFNQVPLSFCVNVKRLKNLFLEDNKIFKLAPDFGVHFSDLVLLSLKRNLLKGLEPVFGTGLKNLYFLDMSENYLTSIITSKLHILNNLSYLYVNSNAITVFPKEIAIGCQKLYFLNLNSNLITDLPVFSHSQISSVRYLDIGSNKIENIRGNFFIGFPHLVRINLSNNCLRTLPHEILRYSPSLKIDLSGNNNFSLMDVQGKGIGLVSLKKYFAENIKYDAFSQLRGVKREVIGWNYEKLKKAKVEGFEYDKNRHNPSTQSLLILKLEQIIEIFSSQGENVNEEKIDRLVNFINFSYSRSRFIKLDQKQKRFCKETRVALNFIITRIEASNDLYRINSILDMIDSALQEDEGNQLTCLKDICQNISYLLDKYTSIETYLNTMIEDMKEDIFYSTLFPTLESYHPSIFYYWHQRLEDCLRLKSIVIPKKYQDQVYKDVSCDDYLKRDEFRLIFDFFDKLKAELFIKKIVEDLVLRACRNDFDLIRMVYEKVNSNIPKDFQFDGYQVDYNFIYDLIVNYLKSIDLIIVKV